LKFLERQSIRGQLATAIGVLLVPLVAAVLWSANRTRLERQHEVQQTAVSVARASAAHLEQYIESLDAIAAAALQHPAVKSLDAGCCQQMFADVIRHQPLLTNIVLTLPDGTLRAAGTSPPAGNGQISRSWIAQVTSTRQPVISEWYKGQISGKPVVTLGYPVLAADGSVAGALGLSIDLSRLQTVFAEVPLPPGSVITMLDRSGLVLARSVDGERFIGTTVGAMPADVSSAAPMVGVDPDGIERIAALAPVRRGAWILSVAIPRRVVPETLRPLWRRNMLIIGGAALALLALGLLVAWQTTLHVNRLRSAAGQIATGDLSPPPRITSPNREFSQLQDAFIEMARNLRETRDALDRQVEQERKMNEVLHSLERQVVRQERLAAVGVLVSGVAHELNNPLQAILGTAELLERQGDLSAAALDEISMLKTQSGRAREIIRNLSRFSSQQSGPPSSVDLRDVVAEVVQLRRRDLDRSGIVLDVELTSSRKVHANFTELEQVMLNFVINAQQSIESSAAERGRILLRVSDAGRRVRVEVLDNGAGVDPANEPKLFQPFFTTKPVGKGTGLGLSVSYGIIDSYGGTIGYLRNEWNGATFFFELPTVNSLQSSVNSLQSSVDSRQSAGANTDFDV
jgi:C4-dicarboxylate-specific signal transduction histidine kinase